MPVAMMITSASRSEPSLNERRRRPACASIPVSVAPVRISTPCFRSHASTSDAPWRSIMRGRIWGAISTMVSFAPSARIELRMVKAMKPAPTITTWLPGPISASTPRACWSVQKLWTPGPSAPGTGARTGRRPRRDQEVVVLEHRPVVERELPGLGVEARRPAPDVAGHAQPAELRGRRREDVGLGDGAAEIVREDHPRVGPLRRDQDDLRALALLLPDRVDRVVAGGAAPDDDVPRRHQCLPFPPAGTSVPAARVAAKSPSQSTVSASS